MINFGIVSAIFSVVVSPFKRGVMRGVMRDKIITNRSLHAAIRRGNFISRTPNIGGGDYISGAGKSPPLICFAVHIFS